MASTRPPVGDLHVFTKEGSPTKNYIELPNRSIRYKIVEDIADMGLCVLETPEGRDTLLDIATRMLNHLDGSSPPVPHLYRRPMGELPQEIDLFLRTVRRRFPHVYLDFMAGEGMAVRQNWYKPDQPTAYDPQLAVEMHLNRSVINNMIHASQQPPDVAGDNYDLFRYQMLITMAHEITHFLMGYFTGTGRPFTPPTVSLGRYGDHEMGESGRALEGELLGGVVEFYEDRNDPLGNRQAGVPYLIDDGYSNSRARQISTGYIIDFVNGGKVAFDFPVRTSTRAPPTTRGDIQSSGRKETSQLRSSRARHAQETTSPPRAPSPGPSGSSSAGPSSASRNRMPPVQIAYRSGAGRPVERYREEREEREYYYLEEEPEERRSYGGGGGGSSSYAGSSSRPEERSSRGGGSSSYYTAAPSRPDERGYGGRGGGGSSGGYDTSSYVEREVVYRPARDGRDPRDPRRGYY
ncbi:hypothetical protein B0T22DRAFT_521349 [Podospora appendiculata]|uniref:Uncharacterized protein n=1 Tax=Podospora appendiculata TaxID=314037 RepID=A0AAE1C7Z4_9PEZI|nr:hypothetical protein B0T22DRAFT_521349 [Podospora appendiculata]